MAVLTDPFENAIINHFLRNVPQTAPVTIYIGLLTAAPNEDGSGGTEVAGGSYARQPITLSAPAAGQTSNTAQLLFPTATANWGTLIGSALYTALSGGALWAYAPLSGGSTPLNSGQQYSIAAGAAAFSLD